MDVHEKLVNRAVDQLMVVFQGAGWAVERAILLTYDDDLFWESLVSRLRRADLLVDRRGLPATGNLVSRLSSLRASDLGSNTLVVVQDPVQRQKQEAVCTVVRDVLATGAKLGFIEYPYTESPYAHQLRCAYLQALAYPVEELVRNMRDLRKRLMGGPMTLTSASGQLEIKVSAVHDDVSVLAVGPQILQLPLGEVWALVTTANGIAACDMGIRGVHPALVRNGEVRMKGRQIGAIVELGIGVNPAAIPLPTSLSEKTAGRFHIGFGDDALIGGTTEADSHFDLLLSLDTTLLTPVELQ